MAHRLFGRGLLNGRNRIAKKQEQFKNLLILDLEATCDKNATLTPQEIIEFPCIALNTDDWQVKDVFHQYIKPRINPILTPFCTDLTGIMQENVDRQPHFPEIFKKFDEWLSHGGFVDRKNPSAFVTCGDWDLKVMLPQQCALDDIKVPKYFDCWIDLKKIFCEATNYYPRSLRDMLLRLDIPLQGKLHSGLCDAQNMARIIIELTRRHDAVFKITSPMNMKIKDFVI